MLRVNCLWNGGYDFDEKVRTLKKALKVARMMREELGGPVWIEDADHPADRIPNEIHRRERAALQRPANQGGRPF
jgi:hypothetical protein